MSYVTDRFDNEVTRRLEQGGIGFMPSDTIYGLSACALDRGAVERIHKIKQRDQGKPLIVLISNIKMLDLLSINQKQAEIIKGYWPGAVSMIFQTNKVPDWLQLGTDSLAVRLPAKQSLAKLINRVGPIVSTSANLQGESPINSAAEAAAKFGDQLDFYVDAGPLASLPSTLVVAESGQLRVVRPGAVKIKARGDKHDAR